MSKKSVNLLDNFQSPATAYEIVLKELNNSINSKDEKIIKVFEVFDVLLPNLGVYHQIMKMIRQEFYDAVFGNSDQHFTGSNSEKKDNSSIQRVPFYTLYKQILNSRDDRNISLTEELKEKQNLLDRKEAESVEQKSIITNLRKELLDALNNVESLKNALNDKTNEINELKKKSDNSIADYKKIIEDLEKILKERQEKIEKKEKELSDLSIYKNAYDEIHYAFSPNAENEESRYSKKTLGSSRKNQIVSDILNAKKLEEQVLTLINISTEEFDKFIEKQNLEIKEKIKGRDSHYSNESSALNRYEISEIYSPLNKYEKSILAQEMELEKSNYKKSIFELKEEYEMIVQHRLGLEEKLYLLEADRETNEFVKRQKVKAANSANAPNPNNALQGLEEHFEPIRRGADKDQFAYQDRIFSKWACAMHTSTNGTVWYDCKQVKFCNNCGEKTFICPHKLSLHESIIKIPPNTLYLKFSRPKLQYNQFMVKRAIDGFKKQVLKIPETDIQSSESINMLTNYMVDYPVNYFGSKNKDATRILNEGNAELGMERTISIITQFLAFIHHKEVNTNEHPVNVVDSLYEYFENRYELDEIKFGAVYDFFASISVYAARSKLVEIFCHVLIGNLDRGILNYILYMAEVIDQVQWVETEDVKIFFTIIYPYCDDDELDNLSLDYISFSENKINKVLVLEFIMTLIMKKREFLVNEMEFRLSSEKTTYEYQMTEPEFGNCMEDFFFINNEKQVQVAFETSLAHCIWDGYTNTVPVTKLAHIGAFFCIIQTISELKEPLNNLISEARQKALEAELKLGPVPNKANQFVEPTEEFLKISDIDTLAATFKKET